METEVKQTTDVAEGTAGKIPAEPVRHDRGGAMAALATVAALGMAGIRTPRHGEVIRIPDEGDPVRRASQKRERQNIRSGRAKAIVERHKRQKRSAKNRVRGMTAPRPHYLRKQSPRPNRHAPSKGA